MQERVDKASKFTSISTSAKFGISAAAINKQFLLGHRVAGNDKPRFGGSGGFESSRKD